MRQAISIPINFILDHISVWLQTETFLCFIVSFRKLCFEKYKEKKVYILKNKMWKEQAKIEYELYIYIYISLY